MSKQAAEDHDTFFSIYQNALNALASEAEVACDAMGEVNVPWQIQDEIGSHAWLADSPALGLDDEQRDGIKQLALAVKALPPEAVAPPGAYMESTEGCLKAMRHPAWAPLRREAARLAELLEEAFDRSDDFLHAN